MASSPWVIDVTSADFQDQVVERSRERPVVVDFWAPWCGPCRALGPALEALAVEKDGAFLLAKVNTDEHPDLAQAFQVNGIPAVFAIRDGKMIDQFEGMLPEDELRAFVDRLAPTEAENALAAAAGLEARDPAAAVGAFRQLFAASPDDPAVRVGLARCLLAAGGSTAEVAALVAPVESGEHADEAARLRTILALRDIPHADADLTAARTAADAAPDSAAAQLRLGQVLAARGDYTAAMDALLAAAAEDKKLGAGAVRELMVNIFTIIGARSPEADDYRDRLRSLLY